MLNFNGIVLFHNYMTISRPNKINIQNT